MPELPEVETIRRGLEEYLVGHQVKSVEIKYPKIFNGDVKNITGVKIKGVRRFAKVLSIDLSNKFSIVIQIKLTGQLIYRGPKLSKKPLLSKKVLGLPGKHTHIIFYLDEKGILYYNDVRKFGRIRIIKTEEVTKTGFIEKLGFEPFKDLTPEIFSNITAKSSSPVKIVLMDQEKIGGLGNIYANDALWLAKINPKRPANKITSEENSRLYKAILEVLKRGLKYGGASEQTFVIPDGSEGKYQEHTLVYGKEGTLCKRCKKAKVEKFFLSGRGTYFCPKCQK